MSVSWTLLDKCAIDYKLKNSGDLLLRDRVDNERILVTKEEMIPLRDKLNEIIEAEEKAKTPPLSREFQVAIDRIKTRAEVFTNGELRRIIIEQPNLVWDVDGLGSLSQCNIRVVWSNFGHCRDFTGATLEEAIEQVGL